MARKQLILILFVAGLGSQNVFANLEGETWIYHGKDGDHAFPRLGDLRGTPVVALEDLVQRFKLQMTTSSPRTYVISNPVNSKKIEVALDRPLVKGFWGESRLSRPPVKYNQKIAVPIDFADRALRPLLEGQNPPNFSLPSTLFESDIVIDPGHGGNDYGAHIKKGSQYFREKDVAFLFARELKAKLSKLGLRCLLTRDHDVFLTLTERTQIANRSKAKLFVSLHLNADEKKKGQGFEVYLLSLDAQDAAARQAVAEENQIIPRDLPEGIERAVSDLRAQANFEHSLKYAKVASKALSENLKPFGKGVKGGPFYVLYGSMTPALLIELGFLTHPTDRKALLEQKSRKKIVDALALALAKEFKSANTAQP